MARTVTRSDLVLRIRQRADIEGNQHVTDAEIHGLINTHLPEFYDLLVECVPDYFSTTQTLTTDGLTSDYALPADFYKTTIVLVQDSSGRLMPIEPVNDWYQNVYEIPSAGWVVKHLYVGAAPVLDDDTDTVDGINGFEELVVLRCAIDIKNKREEDPSPLMAQHRNLTERIRKMAPRDRGMPPTVRQIETGPRDPFFQWDSLVSGYRIRGGFIQLLTNKYQPWLGVLPTLLP